MAHHELPAQMKARSLDLEKIEQAYGLVRLANPGITLETWLDFASSQMSPSKAPESGILAVEDERGYILGLVGYTVDHDLQHGRTLLAKNFIALSYTEERRRIVAFSLIEAMEDIARKKQCRTIRTIVHEPEAALQDAWIIEVLKSSGHHAEARRFIKAVETVG